MRITKLITKRGFALILNQILSTILKRNWWRSVWRICMWILGLKGIPNRIPESGRSLLVKFWILGLGIRNTAQGIRNPTKSGVQVTLTKIRIPVPGIRNRWRGRNQKSKSILDYLTVGDTRLLVSLIWPTSVTYRISFWCDCVVTLRPSDHDPGCHRYLVSDTYQSPLSSECNRTARLPEWTAMVYTEDRKPLKAADWVIIAFYFFACILVGLWVCVLFL